MAHRDPLAIAAALRTVISRPDVAARMARAATVVAPQVRWPAVAARYHELATRLIADAARVAA